jgi:hypothetical protein
MRQRTNASFHDFKVAALFIGMYTGNKLKRTEDDPKDANKKKGDVMGYEFNDADGVAVYVGSSKTIADIMEGDGKKEKPVAKDQIMSFEFQGQGKTKGGKTFNRFQVLEFADWKEAETYHAKAE